MKKPSPLSYIKAQPFRCPNCKRYINFKRDYCRYCLAAITPEIRDAAVRAEQGEIKDLALGSYRRDLAIGLGLIGVGIGNVALLELDLYFAGIIPCLSVLAILIGAVFLFMGTRGLLNGRKG